MIYLLGTLLNAHFFYNEKLKLLRLRDQDNVLMIEAQIRFVGKIIMKILNILNRFKQKFFYQAYEIKQ